MKRIITAFWTILLVLTSVYAGISFAEANEFPYLELHVAYYNRTIDGQADAVVTIAFRCGSGGYAQSCVEGFARTNIKNVNVRQEPTKKSRIVVQLKKKGTKVVVLDEVYDDQQVLWVHIRTEEGSEGYIRGDLLDLDW